MTTALVDGEDFLPGFGKRSPLFFVYFVSGHLPLEQ
jgi:hypothetical protein